VLPLMVVVMLMAGLLTGAASLCLWAASETEMKIV
jgi:hypothetical protein